jgi:tetratricopeptide (TPR) repeat protein
MTRRIRHINGKQREVISNRTRDGFENDLIADSDDSALFRTISEYMKGCLDIEDVKNDPALSVTEEAVRGMISGYNKNISGNKDNEKFIREAFSEAASEENLIDEISQIKQEIGDNKLKEITSEWVKEWHEKKQSNGFRDTKTEEIRDFITSSINSEEIKHVKIRPLFVRYASLAAAALIGAFILIRTLLPSSNPEKLFNSYYKQFDAISPVTRSINNNETDSYSSAIYSYKTGDYERAAIEFADVIQKDPTVMSPRFFMGLTELALGNYDQTINLLTGVVNDSGEYGKEARWYLGLTYLKTGNKPKATECFENLAKSTGFYSDRSEKILRRLK